jgi:hypothetical protein
MADRKPARREALEAPFQRQHEASMEARLAKGRMPKSLPELLRWYSEAWDAEIPDRPHKVEVWRDYGAEAQGGSHLGSPAWTDPMRRYLENYDSEVDADGYYVRPVHAALSRISRRGPLMARSLFAVAQSGYDWRGVADRGHWPVEMFQVYITEALRRLWMEYREQKVRLE